MNEQLISYGPISNEFRVLAKYKNYLDNMINEDKVPQHRLDCYRLLINYNDILDRFSTLSLEKPTEVEIFQPSCNYPPHIDGDGVSYFIPLEEGVFQIEGVEYVVIPFVLYCFDDRKLHNTNFTAIMLS